MGGRRGVGGASSQRPGLAQQGGRADDKGASQVQHPEGTSMDTGRFRSGSCSFERCGEGHTATASPGGMGGKAGAGGSGSKGCGSENKLGGVNDSQASNGGAADRQGSGPGGAAMCTEVVQDVPGPVASAAPAAPWLPPQGRSSSRAGGSSGAGGGSSSSRGGSSSGESSGGEGRAGSGRGAGAGAHPGLLSADPGGTEGGGLRGQGGGASARAAPGQSRDSSGTRAPVMSVVPGGRPSGFPTYSHHRAVQEALYGPHRLGGVQRGRLGGGSSGGGGRGDLGVGLSTHVPGNETEGGGGVQRAMPPPASGGRLPHRPALSSSGSSGSSSCTARPGLPRSRSLPHGSCREPLPQPLVPLQGGYTWRGSGCRGFGPKAPLAPLAAVEEGEAGSLTVGAASVFAGREREWRSGRGRPTTQLCVDGR